MKIPESKNEVSRVVLSRPIPSRRPQKLKIVGEENRKQEQEQTKRRNSWCRKLVTRSKLQCQQELYTSTDLPPICSSQKQRIKLQPHGAWQSLAPRSHACGRNSRQRNRFNTSRSRFTVHVVRTALTFARRRRLRRICWLATASRGKQSSRADAAISKSNDQQTRHIGAIPKSR